MIQNVQVQLSGIQTQLTQILAVMPDSYPSAGDPGASSSSGVASSSGQTVPEAPTE
jgi:hypothetical protein